MRTEAAVQCRHCSSPVRSFASRELCGEWSLITLSKPPRGLSVLPPMLRHCQELANRLRKSIDNDYNVTDMVAVWEIIEELEQITVTKEVLEATRLGKNINGLRRKTTDEQLAKRAKTLVRKWRDGLMPTVNSVPQPIVADTAPVALNGASAQCFALRGLKPQSPALRGFKPQSPLLKTTSLSRVSSPSLSLHSDQSRSPIASPCKLSAVASNNCMITTPQVRGFKVSGQNHLQEAVPRTHSSNKRLRKDNPNSPEIEIINKKQRLNGESVGSSNTNSQVPSLTQQERDLELHEPSLSTESNVVKKRGRKKGSKSIKKILSTEDSVKEKLANISGNTKLKRTHELLADIQGRGSNLNANSIPSHSVNTPNINDVTKTNNDMQVSRYLSETQSNLSRRGDTQSSAKQKHVKVEGNFPNISQQYQGLDSFDEDTKDSVIALDNTAKLSQDLTVEEILAKLPPIDPKSIDWNDDIYVEENEDSDKPKEVTKEDIERLHTECVEGLNGNFQPKLSSLSEKSDTTETCKAEVKFDSVISLHRPSESHKDETFREWHEMLARPSADGQILHILPYVIID